MKIYLNGQLVDREKAVVSVFDLLMRMLPEYSPSAGLFVLLHSPGSGESGARARLASRTSSVATSCRNLASAMSSTRNDTNSSLLHMVS